MRNKNDQPINEVISEMMKMYKLDAKANEHRLISAWPEIMGNAIANHTKEIQIINRRLIITLDSAALRNELFNARFKLTERLNEEMKADVIDEVVFR